MLQIHGPLSIWSTEFMLTSHENKALHGFSFVNMTGTTMNNCLERCLADCLCMSFQMCDNKECQLCASNRHLNATAMHERKGCVNYDFDSKGITKVFLLLIASLVSEKRPSPWGELTRNLLISGVSYTDLDGEWRLQSSHIHKYNLQASIFTNITYKLPYSQI